MKIAELVAELQGPDITTDPATDILKKAPDITPDIAYDIQFALMRERAGQGNSIVGYQASFTSKSAQKLVPSMPVPMVGTLLSSTLTESGEAVTLDRDRYPVYMIESEIGMLLGADLAGPSVTPTLARAAVTGLFPAIEVAPLRPGTLEGHWSNEHLIATHNTGSFVVFGGKMTPPTLDLQTEGLVVRIDGEVRGSATAVEAMGDPFKVLAEMANALGRHGQKLAAGQIVITGSCVAPQHLSSDDRHARVDTTRLGSVEVRIA